MPIIAPTEKTNQVDKRLLSSDPTDQQMQILTRLDLSTKKTSFNDLWIMTSGAALQ